MFIKARDITVGTVLRGSDGPITVTAVRPGDHTPFGKIGKFWHPSPVTLYAGRICLGVFAPDDEIEIA